MCIVHRGPIHTGNTVILHCPTEEAEGVIEQKEEELKDPSVVLHYPVPESSSYTPSSTPSITVTNDDDGEEEDEVR